MSGDVERARFQENCTQPFKITARQLLQTITRDLDAARLNALIRERRKQHKAAGASGAAVGRTRALVVLPKHLRRANDERDVLKAMLRQRQDGVKGSNPFPTRLLYENRETIEEALKMANEHYGAS